jgi:hypothetical protein
MRTTAAMIDSTLITDRGSRHNLGREMGDALLRYRPVFYRSVRRTESRRYWSGIVAMQSIATTTDDLKDREINAEEIHGVHPKWGYGGAADPGTEVAL